ncbi:folate family ECF transporter S component, partial [Streptococcus suis]
MLAAIAMTWALVMVVENYFSIRISDTLQVQFTFSPNTILGAIAGPVWSAVFAAISDPLFVLFSGQTVLFTWMLIEE